MAGGRRQLAKVQLGKETTAGVAVPATTIWRGPFAGIDDQSPVNFAEENVGVFGGTDRSYIPRKAAQVELPETEATFEQLPYLLAALFGGPTSGTADGTGSSGYIYTTNVPEKAAPNIVTFTLEAGDDVEVEEMEYAHCTQLSLQGVGGEAVRMGATLQGRQTLPSGFTSGLTLPPVEEILFSRGKIFLDNVGGAYGTTRVSNQLLSFELSINAQWVPKYTADGELYFSFSHYVGHEITGRLTYEHDSTSIAGVGGEKEKKGKQIPRLLRLLFEGSDYTTPGTGTTYTKKSLVIDLPIKYTRFNPLDEQDGNSIVVADFESRYNEDQDDAGSFTVVNENSTLA